MNFRFTSVETSLNRAEFRWKWLRFLEFSFLLGALLGFLVLLFGVAIVLGLVASKSLVTTLFASLAIFGLVAWVVLIIWVAASSPDRDGLAAAMERADRRLMDRLNTLLHLERHREAHLESFSLRIARQTQAVLRSKKARPPFSQKRALRFFLCMLLVLTGTVLFYNTYSPWSRLRLVDAERNDKPAVPEPPLELASPGTNTVEQTAAWGEVRITEPGSDLKVTKVDVVPMQIEAAANEPLQKVSWFSTVNDTGETPHDLPPPNEPRYAVYQPTLYLDELRLSDWDVLTYYAKANGEKEKTFASSVYFLEVRPFREDILKMPGGENGKAYQCLNEMTALINRQQHVIRQTHQFVQAPQSQDNLQAQDRKKLSEAETDLGDSAEHLYAKMASILEHAPIGEALDNLAKAQTSLEQASKQLDTNNIPQAQSKERSALTELVAARKIFQKAVSENPKSFEDQPEEQQSPVADSAKKLNEMAEFRNEAKAAQDFVRKSLERQRALEQQANSASRAAYPRLSTEERELDKSLRDFQDKHPKVFKEANNESNDAHQALTNAANALENRGSDARTATHEATEQLEKLCQATGSKSAAHQLTDAYRLKQMLDQEIQTMANFANGDGKVSEAELQKTVSASRETINQLKNAAEQEPTRDSFDKPLREALSGNNKVDLDTKLNQVQQAQDAPSKKERTSAAKEALSKVSRAFSDSEPKTLQMAGKNDSLKGDKGDSLKLGMAELESLIKQLERQKISPEDRGKQGQEALFNLQTGLRSFHGSNEQGEQILVKLEQALKAEALDVGDLKKLMDQLEHFSVETSDQLASKQEKPDVTNIDPSRLPPAYRGRIQKYFQKLSEK